MFVLFYLFVFILLVGVVVARNDKERVHSHQGPGALRKEGNADIKIGKGAKVGEVFHGAKPAAESVNETISPNETKKSKSAKKAVKANRKRSRRDAKRNRKHE